MLWKKYPSIFWKHYLIHFWDFTVEVTLKIHRLDAKNSCNLLLQPNYLLLIKNMRKDFYSFIMFQNATAWKISEFGVFLVRIFNTRKCGPVKLQIEILLTQCVLWTSHLNIQKDYAKNCRKSILFDNYFVLIKLWIADFHRWSFFAVWLYFMKGVISVIPQRLSTQGLGNFREETLFGPIQNKGY